MNEVDCVFCKLLSGELEVSLVHQDDACSAFMDIQPVNPGHTLVIPNRHAPYLADLDADDGAKCSVSRNALRQRCANVN